jgi:hypothetical protein
MYKAKTEKDSKIKLSIPHLSIYVLSVLCNIKKQMT